MIELRRPMSVATWTYQMVKHGKTTHYLVCTSTQRIRTLQHDPGVRLSQSWMASKHTSNHLSNRYDSCHPMILWLVVSTPLKNISQLGWLFPIYGKIKNVPNHQPVLCSISLNWPCTSAFLNDLVDFIIPKSHGPRLFRFAFRHPGLVGAR
jgi:hypothetical protein